MSMRRSGGAVIGLTLALCLCIAPASGGLLDGAPREAVTTGISDARPVSPSLALYLKGLKPDASRSLSFPAGYFHLRLQSYCLHAGTYGPTTGDGYLLAPLKGDQAGLIGSILQRSIAHFYVKRHQEQTQIKGGVLVIASVRNGVAIDTPASRKLLDAVVKDVR